MKLYAISTKYLPLVSFQLYDHFHKPIKKKQIHVHDLQNIFNSSKQDTLIACYKKEDAFSIASLLLNTNNIKSDLIPEDINLFAVLVVYTVEVDGVKLKKEIISADHLVNYSDISTIPCHNKSNAPCEIQKKMFQENMKTLPPISICRLDNLDFENVQEASYRDVSAKNIVNVNLKPNFIISFFRNWMHNPQPTNNESKVYPLK